MYENKPLVLFLCVVCMETDFMNSILHQHISLPQAPKLSVTSSKHVCLPSPSGVAECSERNAVISARNDFILAL
jgi:hypothetical protein